MTVAVKMIFGERDAHRHDVEIDATLRNGGVNAIDVDIEEISVSGFRMITSVKLTTGELITIGLAGLGMQPAVVVRNMSGRYGCQFVNTVPQSYIDQLQVGHPSTVVPFVSVNWLSPTTGAPVSDVDDRFPLAQRIAIFFGLGAATWVPILAIWKSLF